MVEVKIDKKKCNLCGTCITVCPMEVFSKGEKEILIDEPKCIACHACELQCDKKAITVKD